MRCVRVRGLALHVAEDGDPGGLPVLFLGALGTDLRVWNPLLPHLPPGLRLIRMDQRGHGLSDGPPPPWSIADLAADAAGVLDALGVARAAVVGLSVGGMAAQALAAAEPARVAALALSGTAPRIGTREAWEDRMAAVRAGGMAAVSGAALERWFTPGFRSGDPALPLWRVMLERTPVEGYLATCAAIRDADLTEAARSIRAPTLCLVGDADGSTPPELVRETAGSIPGARFAIITDAGHLPGVERPAETARLIGAFLAEAGRDGAAGED